MQTGFSGFSNESFSVSDMIYLTNALLMGRQDVSKFFATATFVHPWSPVSLIVSLG